MEHLQLKQVELSGTKANIRPELGSCHAEGWPTPRILYRYRQLHFQKHHIDNVKSNIAEQITR